MPPISLRTDDSVRLGVLFAGGAALALPIMDGLVKSLVVVYPVLLVAWWRFAVMSAVLLGVGARRSGWQQFRSRAPWLQAARALLMVAATAGFYAGLNVLPLAECTAIMFLAPALSVLMAYVVLHERPGAWGWAAIAASLLGVFAVIRPGSRMFDVSALYVVGAALAYAGFSLLTRVLARHDAAHVTTLWSALGALLLFSITLPQVWMPIQRAFDLHLLLAVGLLGTVGQLLFSRAFRHAGPHVIAPISYLSLLVALALGWLGFGEVPDGWSFLGMSLIAAAALAVATGRTKTTHLYT